MSDQGGFDFYKMILNSKNIFEILGGAVLLLFGICAKWIFSKFYKVYKNGFKKNEKKSICEEAEKALYEKAVEKAEKLIEDVKRKPKQNFNSIVSFEISVEFNDDERLKEQTALMDVVRTWTDIESLYKDYKICVHINASKTAFANSSFLSDLFSCAYFLVLMDVKTTISIHPDWTPKMRDAILVPIKKLMRDKETRLELAEKEN